MATMIMSRSATGYNSNEEVVVYGWGLVMRACNILH